jgi:hypothetical protein
LKFSIFKTFLVIASFLNSKNIGNISFYYDNNIDKYTAAVISVSPYYSILSCYVYTVPVHIFVGIRTGVNARNPFNVL